MAEKAVTFFGGVMLKLEIIIGQTASTHPHQPCRNDGDQGKGQACRCKNGDPYAVRICPAPHFFAGNGGPDIAKQEMRAPDDQRGNDPPQVGAFAGLNVSVWLWLMFHVRYGKPPITAAVINAQAPVKCQ